MDDQIIATAYVDVRLKIKCTSTWSYETTVAQVDKQAKDDALNILHQRLAKFNDMTLVGDPEVTAVIAKRGDQ